MLESQTMSNTEEEKIKVKMKLNVEDKKIKNWIGNNNVEINA